MHEDRLKYNKVWPWYTLTFDPDQKYLQWRVFSLWVMMLFMGGVIASKIYERERMRYHWTERMNIQD